MMLAVYFRAIQMQVELAVSVGSFTPHRLDKLFARAPEMNQIGNRANL